MGRKPYLRGACYAARIVAQRIDPDMTVDEVIDRARNPRRATFEPCPGCGDEKQLMRLAYGETRFAPCAVCGLVPWDAMARLNGYDPDDDRIRCFWQWYLSALKAAVTNRWAGVYTDGRKWTQPTSKPHLLALVAAILARAVLDDPGDDPPPVDVEPVDHPGIPPPDDPVAAMTAAPAAPPRALAGS